MPFIALAKVKLRNLDGFTFFTEVINQVKSRLLSS